MICQVQSSVEGASGWKKYMVTDADQTQTQTQAETNWPLLLAVALILFLLTSGRDEENGDEDQ